MTSFPWKLFKNGQEVVFPKGSRRFVQFDVQQIQNSGAVEFDWNANAVWTGDDAFRLHAVTISCTDQTPAPISDLWQGHIVRLEAPFEFAVPGPSAVLKYDPVPGSVYGVDANDRTVGTTASGSRTVSIPGAVAIRFRPTMDCRVVSRTGPGGSQGRADASWSIEMVELAEAVEEEANGETIRFEPLGLRIYEVGTPLSFSAGGFVTTNTGLPVTYSLVSGSWPAGISMTSGGLVAGNPTEPGLRYVVVRAASGSVYADQAVAFYCPGPAVAFAGTTLQTYAAGTAFSLDLGGLVATSDAEPGDAPTFSVVAGTLPAGLSLNASTGVVSGTPTGYGPRSVRFRATLGSGEFAEQTVAFDAAAPTIVSNGISLQNYTVGTPYSLDLATLVDVANTTDEPEFALVLGSLPAGLTLTDGVVSGTPTAYGAYAASFSATLPTGQSTDINVALFQQNPDDLPDAVILGGTAQTWLESGASGSTTYDAADFTASDVLTVIEAGWVEYILVGGGAGGASVSSTAGGGGGGAGGFRRERIYLAVGTYNVFVGGGGGPGVNGSGTSFNDGALLVRSVGGGGRGGSTNQAGNAGASGGGGGGGATTGGAGGTASSIDFGSDGGAGSLTATASLQHGGGGGGFSTIGIQGPNGRGHGGGGIKVRLWAVLEFCGGGGGGSGSGGSGSGAGRNGAGNGGSSNAAGVAAAANSGSGGGGAGGFTSGTRTGGAGGSGRAIFIVKRRTAA